MLLRKSFPFGMTLLLVLSLSGCFLTKPIPPEKAVLRGSAVIPVSRSVETVPLSGATVEIVDPGTGATVAKTTTNENGSYQVEVPADGPYLVRVEKGNAVLLLVSPPVEGGKTYHLGTADAFSTAVALIFMARVERGEDPRAINLEEIAAHGETALLASAVEAALLRGENPLTSQGVLGVLENISSPGVTTTVPLPSGDGYGTIRIVVRKSRLIPQDADSLLLIVRDATRKIVKTFDLPQDGGDFSASLRVPVSTYEVYAFSMKKTTLSIVSRFLLTSGKARNVAVRENETTEVSITLQPFTCSFTIPEEVSSGETFAVEAEVRGAGVEIWNEPFLLSAYFAYSTSSWNPNDLESNTVTRVFRNTLTRVAEDTIKITFTVNAPVVSENTTIFYRVVVYQASYDYVDYLSYWPYLALPESCGELQVSTERTGTLSIVIQ